MSKMSVQEMFVKASEKVATLSNQKGKQVNGSTKREYKGFNAILLYLTQKENESYTNQWFTYEQAKEAGKEVKADCHGTAIFNFKLIDKDGKKVKVLRYYLVFNETQLQDAGTDSEAQTAF